MLIGFQVSSLNTICSLSAQISVWIFDTVFSKDILGFNFLFELRVFVYIFSDHISLTDP